ncbi:hypothetical protein [Vandammella animalimorsus]|uniref:hypothetical protein n=1 Tax=Vandammella animalimorsus TaxID=2029117 RepID=UPI0011C3B4AB|nr:hypothetical protein [Vandammella animalimorsus]
MAAIDHGKRGGKGCGKHKGFLGGHGVAPKQSTGHEWMGVTCTLRREVSKPAGKKVPLFAFDCVFNALKYLLLIPFAAGSPDRQASGST